MDRAQLGERRLVCVECGAASDGLPRGWRAVLTGGVVEGVDVEDLEVGVYCPACADAEFGA